MEISTGGVKRYCKAMRAAGIIYLWGADSEVITGALFESLKKRFGTKHYQKMSIENIEGKIGADCSGFLRPLSGHDNTAAGYYEECVERGDISKMPKDKMCLIFRREEGTIVHVGIYDGSGMLYEMWDGCEYRGFKESEWTCYGIPEWIKQTEKPPAVGDTVTLEKVDQDTVAEPEKAATLYRVRKTWEDSKSQLGAYKEYGNAERNCPAGYAVYNDNGKEVYRNNAACVYTVKRGDTLGKIAKEYGTNVDKIVKDNRGTYPKITANFIQVGWKLVIK